MVNQLYYGDNLEVLRDSLEEESVDLIYLDPPFNSNATYNVLFRAPSGEHSAAQIEAFGDTWHWNEAAEQAYWEVLKGSNTSAAKMLEAMRGFLGENDMMAYLAMMAVRLIELHRVLKPTGSLYLHCDPTASHYLKILLDAVFGKRNYQNEIVWSYRRWPTKANRFQRMHDILFFYSKMEQPATFNVLMQPPTESSQKRWKGAKQKVTFDEAGNRNPTQEVENEESAVAMNAVWNIPIIAPMSKERLGYPTQKPLALLERVLMASSNEGDLVLDPFCGCGTTVHAAEKLKRQWIGIDITHLAIALVDRRLREAFPKIRFETHGVPKDLDGARALAEKNKFEFERWVVSLIPDAQPYKSKGGADAGIDGIIYLRLGKKESARAIISVKGGKNINVGMVRDLKGTIEREKAAIGIFLTLTEPTQPMLTEAAASGFFKHEGKQYPRLQILTIEALLEGQRPRAPLIDSSVFKKASREDPDNQTELDL